MATQKSGKINVFWLFAIIALFVVIVIGFVNRKQSKELAAKVRKAIKDPSTIYGDSRDLNFNQALNPNYHTGVASYTAVDIEQARTLDKKIHDADRSFNDDEEAVYTAVSAAGTKAFMSLVSQEFEKLYATSLLTYLNNFLDTDELTHVKELMSQLA